MIESFGNRLRQRREAQSIELGTIAEETKIKRSLLDALERDDVSQWPSGIFRRAFIRAYAHAIGLNPDEVVREFLELYPDPVEDVAPLTAVESAADGGTVKGNPPTRFSVFVGSALGSWSRPRTPLQGAPEVAGRVQRTPEFTAELPPARQAVPEARGIDILAVADLCTDLARVQSAHSVQPLLREAAIILDAIGLIVWVWDDVAAELRPVLAHGYSEKVLAQLPNVRRDADNATAAAFRSERLCAIKGSFGASSALVVPLLTPGGCAGVFAIELQHGAEQKAEIRSVATILAALLTQLVNVSRASGDSEAAEGPEATEAEPSIRHASA